MPMEVGNSYNSYYTQTINKSINGSDKAAVNSKSIIDKPDKTVSKEEYFKNLCNEHPNVNINMSDSYLFRKNEAVTFNVSPKLIEKSMRDPKAAANLNRLLDLAPSFPQYLSMHKYMPDGREVTKVSFVIDENGGVSCDCEYKENKSKKTDEESYIEKLRKKKLKALTEERAKMSKQQKLYYNNTTKVDDIIDLNFLDTKI